MSLPPGFEASTSPPETLEGKRFYDPKHFHALGVLFSGLVPIWMSAANWGQLGKARTRWLWLLGGLAAYAALFVAVRVKPGATWYLGLGLNVLLAYYLRDAQRPLFRDALARGATPRAWWQGTLFGTGLLVVAFMLSTFGVLWERELRVGGALKLIDQGRYAQAQAVLENVLHEDPEDGVVVFDVAISHLFQAHWLDAIQGFERTLVLDGADTTMTLACLSIAHAGQGNREASDSLAAEARSRNPAIFVKTFGVAEAAVIADSIVHIPRR